MSATNRGGLARVPNDFYETPAETIDLVLDVLGITDAFDGYIIDACSGTGAIANRVAVRAPRADIRAVELDAELVAKAKEARAPSIAFECHDWLTWESDGQPDFIIANPPYEKTHYDPDKLRPCPKCKSKKQRHVELVQRPSTQDLDMHAIKQVTWSPLECSVCSNGENPPRGGLIVDDAALAEKCVRKALQIAGKKGIVAMLLRESYMIPGVRKALRNDFGLPDRHALERRPSFNGSGTDACDYAWHVWSPKKGGRWSVLSPRT